MGIRCKLCGKEVAALAGGRCRKCGKLVCGDCLSVPGTASAGEASPLCRECGTAREPAREPPPPPPAGVTAGGRMGLPRPAWVLFGLLLLLIFTGIAYYPLIEARILADRLLSSDRRAASPPARRLERMATTPALRALADAAQGGTSLQTRLLATEALGRIAHPEARRVLASIIAAPDTPPAVRAQARESLALQRRFER